MREKCAMEDDGRRRVIIENLNPEIDGGRFPIKRVIGEKVVVTADIFADGHDAISANLLYRSPKDKEWKEAPMTFVENDRWRGEFWVERIGAYRYTVVGWVDYFRTWQRDMKKKYDAHQDLKMDLLIGAKFVEKASQRATRVDKTKIIDFSEMLRKGEDKEAIRVALSAEITELMDQYPDKTFAVSYKKELPVWVDREKALFSTWYELFPRSCSKDPNRHGIFKDCERLLPEIARMGFDILYLPPVHPIGRTNRKGKNNVIENNPDDVGSPWAIGSEEGGHQAIHPQLGTLGDFERLIVKAKTHGIELAMDLAFQCSPDHPYVKEYPDWFRWRPDGSIQFAENPPKKYEDIIPLNFETEKWQELWEELKTVVLFWIERGIRIFRVDNPHTKPFSFWE